MRNSWHIYKPSLEMAAIVVFLIVLISNFAVIEFYVGYFNYHRIPFSSVGFAPQMYDYVQITLPAFAITIVVFLMTFVVLKINDFLSSKAANMVTKHSNELLVPFVQKNRAGLRRFATFLELTLKFLNVGLFLYILWLIFFLAIPKAGETYAHNQKQYISTSERDNMQQELIIYSSPNSLITRTYDISTKSFRAGFDYSLIKSYKASVFNIQ